MKNTTTRIIKNVFLLLLLLILTLSTTSSFLLAAEEAKEEEERPVPNETIDFRVLATGDLHGQLTAFNYETGKEDPTSKNFYLSQPRAY